MQKRFDLNLLNTFDALWRERSVTRAAQRLNVTQPAVSNALGRLRETFGDELFIRTPSGVEPTERCREIALDVRRALHHVERTLAPHDSFDPKTSERVFRIGSADYFDHVVLPPLMQRLLAEAPRVDLRIVHGLAEAGLDAVDGGDLDFMVAPNMPEAPKRIAIAPIIEERFVLIMREGHPQAGASMDLETYANMTHVTFSQRGDARTQVDDMLADHGLRRRVGLTSAHHTSIAETVRDTDLVALSPSRLARRYVGKGGVVIASPPLEIPSFHLHLYWSRRLNTDPGAMWLKSLMMDVAASLPLEEMIEPRLAPAS
ncbi:MAG: LysR family transcriptional regulator [Pseudomonadota bacterium]